MSPQSEETLGKLKAEGKRFISDEKEFKDQQRKKKEEGRRKGEVR